MFVDGAYQHFLQNGTTGNDKKYMTERVYAMQAFYDMTLF